MADTVTSQTIFDGSKYCVMKFTNVSDGTGESAVTKVDVSTLSPIANEVVIEEIIYTIFGISVQLLWDANTDIEVLTLNQGQDSLNFKNVGGLKNNAGEGKTGDIKLSTIAVSSNDSYSIILKMRKK